MVAIINQNYLTSSYHSAMLAGLFLCSDLAEKTNMNILQLGTGAGTFAMFLYNNFKQVVQKITIVDINPDILGIGRKYFGFETNDKLEHITDDAYIFARG